MKVLQYIGLTILALILLEACIKPPNYSDVPNITNARLNKSAVYQGNSVNPDDTLIVQFDFTDGDGDLSNEDSTDVFFQDSRGGIPENYRLPLISPAGANNGLSGTVTVKINNKPNNICCIFTNGEVACSPNGDLPTNTFYYTIQIKDRAGNFSNELQTPEITILCNE